MRKVSNQRGRPLKHGELLEKEERVKFALSTVARMDAMAAETGMTRSELHRRAVDQYLSRRADAEARDKPPPINQVTFDLKPDEAAQVDKMLKATPFDYMSREQFAYRLLMRMTEKTPQQVTEIVIGDFLRKAEQAKQDDQIQQEAEQGNSQQVA